MEIPTLGRYHKACFACAQCGCALAGVPWGRTLLGQADEGYVFMLCDEDRVAIVGRRQREPGAPFGGAAVWRPEGGGVLYCVEAWWEADGPLREVRHLVWADEEQ